MVEDLSSSQLSQAQLPTKSKLISSTDISELTWAQKQEKMWQIVGYWKERAAHGAVARKEDEGAAGAELAPLDEAGRGGAEAALRAAVARKAETARAGGDIASLRSNPRVASNRVRPHQQLCSLGRNLRAAGLMRQKGVGLGEEMRPIILGHRLGRMKRGVGLSLVRKQQQQQATSLGRAERRGGLARTSPGLRTHRQAERLHNEDGPHISPMESLLQSVGLNMKKEELWA
ncbi:unnamed protein product [Linum trigynum]|uniref:Uncharacterized protein n=1 Tax=Linum trigynum TaxID=586398 RepID=A0AAV2FB33_9ROSI